MMTYHWSKVRSQLSAWFLGIFLLVILSAAIISELFQSSPLPSNLSQLYVNPISNEQLAQVASIDFKSKFGEFKLIKNVDSESVGFNTWGLTSPRHLPAKSDAIESIFKTLLAVKVKKLHQFEPINIASFSLDNPLVAITLHLKDESLDVNFGLINPIDNSAYMTVSGKKTIYQVESLEFPLESFELTSFIESKIFLTKIEEISKLQIYRGKNKNSHLEISKLDGKWVDYRKKELNKTRVDEFIKKLTTYKSQIILDKSDEKLKKKLEKQMKRVNYRVVISRGDRVATYQVSRPIRAIGQYKIENRKSVLVQSNTREHPYIVKKELLKLLETRTKVFKGPSIKKLFY